MTLDYEPSVEEALRGLNEESASSSEGPGKRVHVSLPASLARRLEVVRGVIHAPTLIDTLKEALKIYVFLLRAHLDGREVIVRDPKTKKETTVALFI